VQGRIVFGDAVTVADTETIDSIEFGLRSQWFSGRLTANATAFWYETDDQQLTAVGGAGNFNQLLNADHVIGSGVEVDLTLRPVDAVEISAGYSYNDTEIDNPGLEVGICAANVACTVLDPVNPATGNALIDGNRLPQAPKHIANLAVRYGMPLPDGMGEIYLAGDLAYRSSVSFFLYQSREFSSDEETRLGLRAGYTTADRRYEFSAFGRNVLDDRSINGGIDFNNLAGFVSDPALWGVEAIARF
jgi:iron complex outermembrane receptor protein